MHVLEGVIVLALGLIAGSYLGCLAYRLPRKQDTVHEPSRCTRCGVKLNWPELLPLISFWYLGGKCRYCHSSISIVYPLIEAVTALIFLLLWFRFNISFPELVILWAFSGILIAVLFSDILSLIIPDKLLLFGAILLALIFVFNFAGFLFDCPVINCAITAGFLGGVFMLGILGGLFFISHGRWLGFGDVKLGLFLGFLFGFPAIINIFYIAFISGAILGIILLLLHRAKRGSMLPLGAFLSGAAIFYLLFPVFIFENIPW